MKTARTQEEVHEFEKGMDGYIDIYEWEGETVVQLDGEYSVEELEMLVEFLKGEAGTETG